MRMCRSHRSILTYNDLDKNRYGFLWYRVALVCRYWRSVALSTQEIFTCFRVPIDEDPSSDATDFLSSWLARSKSASLTVFGELGGDGQMWQHVIPHFDHTDTINVKFYQLRGLPSFWPSSCPQIKRCCLFPGSPVSHERLIIAQKLLDSLPNLCEFEVHSSYVNLLYLPVPHISSSCLRYLAVSSEISIPTPDSLSPFISKLRSMPLLEELKLQNMCMYYQNPTVIPQSQIAPSSVRHLTVGRDYWPTAFILNSFRGLESIHGAITVEGPALERVSSLCEILRSLHSDILRSIVTAQLNVKAITLSSFRFTFKGWSSFIPFRQQSSSEQSVILELTLHCTPAVKLEPATLVETMITFLSNELLALRSLDIACGDLGFHSLDPAIATITTRMPNLRALRAKCDTRCSLADNLGKWLLPTLSMLHITIYEQRDADETMRCFSEAFRTCRLHNDSTPLVLVLELTGLDSNMWDIGSEPFEGLVKQSEVLGVYGGPRLLSFTVDR